MNFLLFFHQFQSWAGLEKYTKDNYPHDEEWKALLQKYCSSEISLLESNECAKNIMRSLWDNFIIPSKNEQITTPEQLADFLMKTDHKTKKNKLHFLAKYGYDIVINNLLSSLSQSNLMALIDKRGDKTNKTALFLATKEGKVKTVAVLLNFNKSIINTKSEDGRYWLTAVHQAAKTGNIACLQEFFNHDERCFHIYDNRADSPLHIAMRNGQIETVKWMLNTDKTLLLIQPTQNNSQMSLHVLAADPYNHQEMIQLFSEKYPDYINHKTAAGETALHLAIKNTAYCNVKTLLDIGADVTIEDAKGNTPLYLALFSLEKNYRYKPALQKNIDIIKLLLSNQNVTLINSEGISVDKYITSGRFSEIIEKVLRQDAEESKGKQLPEPTIIELLEQKRNESYINNNNEITLVSPAEERTRIQL